MKRAIYILAAALVIPLASRGADALTQTLQHGLFEEEANQNLDAAIKAYQSVIAQSDAQRKAVAIALFRLGECYRKLGKTNEATAQYQRLLRDFPEQEQLVKLSRENVDKTGSSVTAAESSPRSGDQLLPEEAQELARLRAMLKDSPDLVNRPDPSNPSGERPLNSAAAAGWFFVAEFLLANGANVNAEDSQRRTPLHRATLSGHKRMVELLLAHGARVDAKDSSSSTPLWQAAASGYLGIAAVLLTNKADVNASGWKGDLPLHVAAQKGFANVAKLLLDDEALVDGRSSDGAAPLHRAGENGQTEVVELLLKHKANVDSRNDYGMTPLRLAAVANRFETVKTLLDAGADPNIKDMEGRPSLFGVEERNIIQLLLDHKADPNTTNNAGRSILAELLERRNHPHGSIQLLLENRANANGVNEYGRPLVFTAVYLRDVTLVDLLLEHGANPNVLVGSESPLYLARRSANEASDEANRTVWKHIEKLLLDHGANENLTRLSKIAYTRPGWANDLTWVTRGTNDFNRYTLVEMIGSLLSVKQNNFSARGYDWPLPFHDSSRIMISRLNPTNLIAKEIQVDLNGFIRSNNCPSDIWLEWGDRILIPERDHGLNEIWNAPSPELRDFLKKCMTRRVQIVFKETTNFVTLSPLVASSRTELMNLEQTSGKSTNGETTLFSFRLTSAVYGANILRTSSDTSRIHVNRIDPISKEPKEWTINLDQRLKSNQPPDQDLWLRDGDVIEIPEKQ